MELAITSFMSTVGFTFAEILKMLVLVGFNFVFVGVVLWRARKPIKALYDKFMTTLDSVPKMEQSITSLNNTLQEHIIQTDLRMDQGEERFKKMETDIQELKSHAGIK